MINRSPHLPQYGFSLLEVLVAMIVLSIGLLALTALQINSLRATNEARRVTNVSLLAKEMADRMRANSSQLVNYAGTSVTESTDAPDCAGATATCSAKQLRQFDVDQWITALAGTVGIVRGNIFRTAGAPDEYTISIQWDADRSGVLAPVSDCNAEDGVEPDGCFKLRFTP